MAKKGAKKSQTDDSSALWDEIQKLGGDLEDLNMLRDVDTGAAGSASKTNKVDQAGLHGDLTEFAKSLGLATSAPEFIDSAKDKPTAKSKKSKAEKIEKSKKTEKLDKSKREKVEKAEKQDKPAKSKKAKEPSETIPEETIPGFKIKSAKDAQPLGKATRPTVESNPHWYTIKLPSLDVENVDKPSEEEVMRKLEYAEQQLEIENELYEKHGQRQKSLSTADKSFVANILSSGTLSDRVSALTLMVQESPVHNIKALNQLMQMVQKKNRREALLAVSSVKDLMVSNLLPSERKLRHFADQPIDAPNVTRAHWILWAFEDRLKRHYFDLIQVMESMAYDPVLHTRQSMVMFFESLLEQKPEQEQNLLRLLVNKLGDKERQLAAKASYLLLKLLNVHPNMKLVVVRTVQELLLSKSATKERAQYYTMITLNQIILSSRDVETANLLLEVYFAFFKRLLKSMTSEEGDEGEDKKETKPAKGQRPKKVYIGQKALKKAKAEQEQKRLEEERSMDNKLMVAVLTGLNRALPFSQMEDTQMDAHVGTIFQIAHAGNFNTVVQSLVLLQQIARTRPAIGDRFYRTLYDSLFDPRLDQTSKKAMYLNVLFRALKSDTSINRVMAFIKRIMQVCLHCQAEFASGALFLVSQLLELNPQMYKMLMQPIDEGEDDEYDSTKRDPRYARAETSCMWEATLLAKHFHPSITHTMQQIMNREPVPAINNLHNHSLTHFLDRFVFRKPKAEDTERPVSLRGQSLMQPFISQHETAAGDRLANLSTSEHLITSKRTNGVIGGLDLTSDNIADMQKSDVRPEEQFFHQFFQTKRQRVGKKSKKSKESAEGLEFADDETGFASAVKDDDMDEDEIWKAMSATIPGGVADESADEDDQDLLDALREGESDEDIDNDDDSEGDDTADSADAQGDSSEEESESESDDNDMDDESQPESSDEETITAGTKRKESDSKESAKRNKKKKIPLFGSFDDYAHLIDTDEGLE
ncbi:RNA-binding ribosome biosynthesis protein mak21 [Coemansia brasiliensis]|uniref:RNA-binding ribosome biosynthesis protein mak21 n=1 Tax=Coemansia brasiliensis TaxID=2650707 RepID=A0A9W8I717_9FUNG|nr:RNA-binding ribosome biosynthesis protein mak21 [Coemansia brasiliensis]